MTPARGFHLATALVASAALVLQLVLVLQGGRVLDEVHPPDLPTRLGRLVAYFTIQSNVLVAIVAWQLARDPEHDGTPWRVVRFSALIGITVTGLVHFFLLRPLLHLDGADWLADKLLHMVVPLIAVAGWALFGPRPRSSVRTAGLMLLWPIVWLVVILVAGAISGWYPYPFLDHREDGVGAVAVACLGITALFVALAAGAVALDRRLPPTGDRADSVP